MIIFLNSITFFAVNEKKQQYGYVIGVQGDDKHVVVYTDALITNNEQLLQLALNYNDDDVVELLGHTQNGITINGVYYDAEYVHKQHNALCINTL